MTWRTHLMGGLASITILPVALDSVTFALACVFAILGSLLPDLDARESKLSNSQIRGVAPLKVASLLLNKRLGHRGAFHSAFALLLVAVLLGFPFALFLDPFAGVGLVLGFASHLLLDACTRSGVPLWWPDKTRVHLLPRALRVTTGSLAEDVVVRPARHARRIRFSAAPFKRVTGIVFLFLTQSFFLCPNHLPFR